MCKFTGLNAHVKDAYAYMKLFVLYKLTWIVLKNQQSGNEKTVFFGSKLTSIKCQMINDIN